MERQSCNFFILFPLGRYSGYTLTLCLQAVFNILILLVVWPWVYIAYRRVLTNLRAKYRGQEVRSRLMRSCFLLIRF